MEVDLSDRIFVFHKALALQVYDIIMSNIVSPLKFSPPLYNAPFTLDEDAIAVEHDKGKMTN